MNNKHTANTDALFETIANLDGVEAVRAFFTDLCTPGEVIAFAQRLMAAKLLVDGYTYEQVIAATDISSATLSRVSKSVKHGDGYRSVLVKDNQNG